MGRDSKPRRIAVRDRDPLTASAAARRKKPKRRDEENPDLDVSKMKKQPSKRREDENTELAADKQKKPPSKRREDENIDIVAESPKQVKNRSTKDAGSNKQSKDETERPERDRPISGLQKQMFAEFTRDAVSKGVKGVLEEYTTNLKAYVPTGVTRKAFDANQKKNRYTDVVCIDNARVVLKNQPNDYIHANFVSGDPLINTFICTQGPMMDSVKDFWKMVAQENVGNIIMLCDTVEQGKEKCQQYWPREEGCTVEWPGVQVKNIKMDNSDSTTVLSTLELIFEKKVITLKHHHWKTWPDKSVPLSYLAAFRLLKNVRHSSRPTIVHCSAGIGRTGTVVAMELCYQQLLSENKLNVLDTVKHLRQMRMHAVQTDLQYLYLFKCLLTLSRKHKTLPAECMTQFDNFEKEYDAMIAKIADETPIAYSPLIPMAHIDPPM